MAGFQGIQEHHALVLTGPLCSHRDSAAGHQAGSMLCDPGASKYQQQLHHANLHTTRNPFKPETWYGGPSLVHAELDP